MSLLSWFIWDIYTWCLTMWFIMPKVTLFPVGFLGSLWNVWYMFVAVGIRTTYIYMDNGCISVWSIIARLWFVFLRKLLAPEFQMMLVVLTSGATILIDVLPTDKWLLYQEIKTYDHLFPNMSGQIMYPVQVVQPAGRIWCQIRNNQV